MLGELPASCLVQWERNKRDGPEFSRGGVGSTSAAAYSAGLITACSGHDERRADLVVDHDMYYTILS